MTTATRYEPNVLGVPPVVNCEMIKVSKRLGYSYTAEEITQRAYGPWKP